MADPHPCSVHLALGGGAVADVLLWRKGYRSIVLLASSTFIWFVFVRAGYNFLSFTSNAVFLLALILFFWAKSASLLNRPPPPLPSLEISEEIVVKVADETRVWMNYALSIAHDIAVGGNLRLFGQLAIGLWVISFIGSLFDFLTLAYTGVLLSLSMPSVYNKHQTLIDVKMNEACKIAQTIFHILQRKLLRMIPTPSDKDKKIR